MLKLIKLNRAGDTIVEAVIAIAVLGFTVALTASGVSRSILAVQDQKEHAQAVQLAESQIEDLRIYGDGSTDYPILCFNINGVSKAIESINGGAGTPQGTNPCIVQSSGEKMESSTAQPAYDIQISYSPNATFTINITWDSPSGDQSNVSLEYRTQ